MAEKGRLFQNRRAEDLIMTSPDPSAHKRIGRGVRNFDNAIWDRVREDAVLAGNFAKFSHNPTMKQHLLITDTKKLAEASPFDSVWGIGLRANDPEVRIPRRWPEKKMFGKALSTVLDAIGTSEARLASHASSQQFCTPTLTGGIHETSTAPPRLRALARACPGPPSKYSTCFSDAPADSSLEVLAVTPGVDPCFALPEHGPCLVGGIISTTPLSPRKSRFTLELTSSRPMVAWRSLTLVPHRPSSDATYWMACSRWGQHPSRASGYVLLVSGVVLANLPLRKLRRASA